MQNPDIRFSFSTPLKNFCMALIVLGFVSLSGAFVVDAKRAWSAFLNAQLFVLFISLGSLFFIAIQHVTKAGWSVNVRRLMEAFPAYIIVAVPFALTLLFSGDHLYSWFNPETVAKDYLLQHKAPYLNIPFFLIRLLICFGIWIFFGWKLKSLSLKQDRTGDPQLSNKSIPYSVAFLILFALSFSFFSFDALMSLEPHWFSTIFAVYTFAGAFQSFIAVLILLIIYLRRQGVLDKKLVNENHLHDLGKFLLGLVIFWAYIAFSQYMLIWYANLPEGAIYYVHRSVGEWKWVSLALIVFRFILPFVFLLPRWVKRDEGCLVLASSLILITQYMDLYWMIYPQFDREQVVFGWIEIAPLIAFVGLFLYSLFYSLSKNPLLPLKDPRQKESASHIVTY